MKAPVNVFWFRRDLRIDDNAGLYHALKEQLPVVLIFIFDKNILDKLDDRSDRRLTFIHTALQQLQKQLLQYQASLNVYYGTPVEVFNQVVAEYTVNKVFTNHDYEPYARQRDDEVLSLLKAHNIAFQTYKDQVIFEKDEVIKDNGQPYTVFTPYSRKWKSTLTDVHTASFDCTKYYNNFFKQEPKEILSLDSIGFDRVNHLFPPQDADETIINNYDSTRDFPSHETGTSRLGVHLRFGTISIRQLVRKAFTFNQVYLNELIWREFYQMILWNFPAVGLGHAFKPAYENIAWRNNEDEFEKWCNGMTGYPIVDAGMRELNATGFMHNRVRMIVASFLTKHLLIDWRWGEAYFAQKLLDYELASNNGGWQWAAGSGCDAAPYFRIFNPRLQTEKFDKSLAYINKWVPELNEFTYPEPIVDHEFARKRALEVYATSINNRS